MLKIKMFEDSFLTPPKPFTREYPNEAGNNTLDLARPFLEAIGPENVVSFHFSPETKHSGKACIILYRDDGLLSCPKCGREYGGSHRFCKLCGVRLAPAAQPGPAACVACGAPLLSDDPVFCTACGARQSEPDVSESLSLRDIWKIFTGSSEEDPRG